MANKNKFAGFMSAADQRLENVFREQADSAAKGSGPSAKEQLMTQAALKGGNFDSSPAVQNALQTYNQLFAEGNSAAMAAGFDPESQDYKDFADYYVYMSWPQNSPISYDDFYNANSKRLETIKAKELENARKASDQKVADFSNAMQQYDTVTGLPLDSSGRTAADYSGGDRNQKTQMDWSFGQWGSPEEWLNYGK